MGSPERCDASKSSKTSMLFLTNRSLTYSVSAKIVILQDQIGTVFYSNIKKVNTIHKIFQLENDFADRDFSLN